VSEPVQFVVRQKKDRRMSLSQRAATVIGSLAVGVALLAASACGSPSERQIAADLVKKGIKEHGAGKVAVASKDYREALVHDPNNKFAYYNLGLIAQASGRLRVAELNYEFALATDPNFAAALFNLGTVLSRTNPPAAAKVYERLVAIQPKNAGAHLNLGFVYKSLGRGDAATKQFDQAMTLDPRLRKRVEGQQ